MKDRDLIVICNALVDILIKVDDKHLDELKLKKGIMHLVDHEQQAKILDRFDDTQKVLELGGSGMNTTRSLAALGVKTSFVGKTGQDLFADEITQRMQALEIQNHISKSSEPTGSCVILVTPDGERTMVTHLGASSTYAQSDMPEDMIEKSRILHFCGYQWDTDRQKDAIKQAIAVAKKSGTLVSFDIADPFCVDRNRAEFRDIVAEYADIVFANREEGRLLFEKDDPNEIIKLLSKNTKAAALKLGSEGALVVINDQAGGIEKISPVATEVVDTTAAGDMFSAGFLYGYLNNLSAATCGKMAATLASDVISRLGAHVESEAFAAVRGMN